MFKRQHPQTHFHLEAIFNYYTLDFPLADKQILQTCSEIYPQNLS